MRYLKYEFGLLFEGQTPEEVDAAIERYLNPPPMEKPQPKKNNNRRRR